MNFTKAQQTAINLKDQALLINANAGAGKTAVLIQRILFLLQEQKIPLENILAITFTDKAAEELKDRLRTELNKLNLYQYNIENSYISTIHGFCSRVLREQCFEAGLNPHFEIISNSTEQEVLVEAAAEEIIEDWLNNDDTRLITLLEIYKNRELLEAANILLEKFRNAGLEPADLDNFKNPADCWSALEKACLEVKPLIYSNLQAALTSLLNFTEDLPEKTLEYLAELKIMINAKFSPENFTALADWLNKKPRKPNNYESQTFEQFSKEFKKIKENFEVQSEVLSFDRTQEEAYLPIYAALLGFIQAVYLQYNENKARVNQLDFTDLLLQTKKLFQNNLDVKEFYQEKFKQIMLDEFQDTDQLQWDIFQTISSPNNLFVVGDWKQSIYRFRNADVDIFLNLIQQFKAAGKKTLNLQENFRSGEPVLKLTNFLAKFIWPANRYDYQDLIFAADQTKYPPQNSQIKINFLTTSETDGPLHKEEKRQWEAAHLVKEIQNLVTKGHQLQDMAILLRATSDLNIYEDALRGQDIPFLTIGGRYYYQRQEIIDLINFVKILNNPLLDLTMAGVLRSPLVGIRDESLLILCQLKTNQKQNNIFNILNEKNILTSVLIDKDKQKLLSFVRLYNFLTENLGKLSLNKLLSEITEQTQYLLYLLSQPDGRQKSANVRKFVELARALSDKTSLSLSRFVRYLEKMQLKEAREEEAAISDSSSNAVKIMTVHKAKGLEFPIVFLPDINRDPGANKSNFSFDFNAYQKYNLPLGFSYQDETGDKYETHPKKLIKFFDELAAQEEAKRLFYVALTRAKEKLFISVILENKPTESVFQSSGNWGKWFSYLYKYKQPELAKLADLNLVSAQPELTPRQQAFAPVNFLTDLGSTYQILAQKKKETISYSKLSTTELAETSYGWQHFLEKYYFEFPAEKIGFGHANFNKEISEQIGNLAHSYLQNDDPAYADKIEKLNWTNEQKNYLKKCLDNYFGSDLYQHLKNSTEKFFELPFDLSVQDLHVNGRLDLLLKTKQTWQIIDFKTNQQTPENLKEYQLQLSVYALALAQALKIEIAQIELKLYYLAENKLVKVTPLPDIIENCLKELK